jgi:hypothetical protein
MSTYSRIFFQARLQLKLGFGSKNVWEMGLRKMWAGKWG